VDVKVARKGHRLRYGSRDKRYTVLGAIPNEYTYTDILELQEPINKKDILVPIASTPTINRPLAAANSNSKCSNSGCNSMSGNSGGCSESQMNNSVGSSMHNGDRDESEDEDDENPPAVIDRIKKSWFTWDLAGLNGNLRSSWEPSAASNARRNQTDQCCRRSGWLEMESAEVD
jgi:hypothetical protein